MSVQARLARLERASKLRTGRSLAVVVRLPGESDQQAQRRAGAPTDAVVVDAISEAYMPLLKGGTLYPLVERPCSSVDDWLYRMGVG